MASREELARQMTHSGFQEGQRLPEILRDLVAPGRERLASLRGATLGDILNLPQLPTDTGNAPGLDPALVEAGLDMVSPLAKLGGIVGALSKAEIAANRAEFRRNLGIDDAAQDTSYWMSHRPLSGDSAATLDRLEDILPDDIYNPSVAGRYYGHGEPALDNKTARILAGLKGNPDAEVTMYRAVPKGVDEINPGDWVTINPDYANLHGSSWVDDGEFDVISMKVRAKDLEMGGDSIHEQGYFPK